MMFSVSTLFLAALVFNAAFTFGAPLRIPDTSSVTTRSEDSSMAARAPVVEKRRIQVVSERGTPFAKPVTTTELAREEPQLVRRYPRKVYHDLYEKREPEPATTVKESTVKITKVTTFDSLADAIAHAKAVGADHLASTVVSWSQTTTIAVPEVSSSTTTSTDTAATPTATATATEAPTTTPVPTTTATETGSVTPTPINPSVVPTGTPTATNTDTPLPTTSATGTVLVTPTPTDPSVISTGTPTATNTDTPLPTTSATGTVSVTPTPTDPSVIPTGTPTATPTTGTETTPAPTNTPIPSGTDLPPTTATGTPSTPPATPDPAHSGLVQRDLSEMLKSLDDGLRSTVTVPSVPTIDTNPLTSTLANSGNPHPNIPAMLSGRQLASSGATLASAMRRRDLFNHLNK